MLIAKVIGLITVELLFVSGRLLSATAHRLFRLPVIHKQSSNWRNQRFHSEPRGVRSLAPKDRHGRHTVTILAARIEAPKNPGAIMRKQLGPLLRGH
jgi:hypothetical protein